MNPIKLYRLFREFLQWRKDQACYRRAYVSLLPYELLPYSAEDIAIAIVRQARNPLVRDLRVPVSQYGTLFAVLCNRSGRGRMPLDEAIRRYLSVLRSEP